MHSLTCTTIYLTSNRDPTGVLESSFRFTRIYLWLQNGDFGPTAVRRKIKESATDSDKQTAKDHATYRTARTHAILVAHHSYSHVVGCPQQQERQDKDPDFYCTAGESFRKDRLFNPNTGQNFFCRDVAHRELTKGAYNRKETCCTQSLAACQRRAFLHLTMEKLRGGTTMPSAGKVREASPGSPSPNPGSSVSSSPSKISGGAGCSASPP